MWPGNSTNNARFTCRQLLSKQVVISIVLRLGETQSEPVTLPSSSACIFVVHHGARRRRYLRSRRRCEPAYLALALEGSARTSQHQYKPPREGELSCLALPPSARFFFSPNHPLAQNRRTGGPKQLCTTSGPLTPPWPGPCVPPKRSFLTSKIATGWR